MFFIWFLTLTKPYFFIGIGPFPKKTNKKEPEISATYENQCFSMVYTIDEGRRGLKQASSHAWCRSELADFTSSENLIHSDG